MNRLQAQDAPQPAAEAPDRVSTETIARLRRVHRAASDLRRGIPVVLRAGETMMAVLAAETAAAGSVAELEALAIDPPILLLAPTRAAAVLRRPVEQGAAAVAVRSARQLARARDLARVCRSRPDADPARSPG